MRINSGWNLKPFFGVKIMATLCETKLSEFSSNLAEGEQKQDQIEGNEKLDKFLMEGARHDGAAIEKARSDELSRLKKLLGRDFSSELKKLQHSAPWRKYLENVGKFDPTAKAARLQEIAAAKQILLDTPDEKSLDRYRQALSVKVPSAESELFSAVRELELTTEQLETDLKLIQEFRVLEAEKLEGKLSQAQAENETTKIKLRECLAMLTKTGVNAKTDREYQQLVFKQEQGSRAVFGLQQELTRRKQLETFSIIK
jgi:hypothetical protein